MRVKLYISLIALLVPFSAKSQTNDPYAAEAQSATLSQYRALRKNFLEDVRGIYYGVGCKVVGAGSEDALMYQLGRELDEEAFENHLDNRNDRPLIQEAIRQGLAKAATPNGCEYWHSHPEAVVELRRRVANSSP